MPVGKKKSNSCKIEPGQVRTADLFMNLSLAISLAAACRGVNRTAGMSLQVCLNQLRAAVFISCLTPDGLLRRPWVNVADPHSPPAQPNSSARAITPS